MLRASILIFPDFVLLFFHAIVLYNRVVAKSQAESTRYEEECRTLSSEADELRALLEKKGGRTS